MVKTTTRAKSAAPKPALPAPLPERLEPMYARLVASLPASPQDWGFEFKWDGERLLAFGDGHRLRLQTRNLRDATDQYPELAALGEALGPHRALLDGELVARDEHGLISFNRLAHRMHRSRGLAEAQARVPLVYLIFDLLYWDGESLLETPYRERRARLEELALEGPSWSTPPSYAGEGQAVLEAARAQHLEGVVAKRLDSPYQPGQRTGLWRKLKLVARQEFVVGGWTPLRGTEYDRVGALLVGYHEPGGLRFAGAVGSGFTDEDRRELATELASRAQEASPFADLSARRGARWARPELVVEVELRGWTEAEHLRQAAFKGRREDKDPRQVVREEPT
ncbi:MAG TPA: non-homologous end-joining DNA ligase [Armatimonadota bacterium]|jgi:bifunctional non-homologous end joining protein LigD